MIEHLDIKNFALIENLSVDFSQGFNVITGETGSGKSIILGALGLLMGEKADSSSIRTGADEMTVNAAISIPEGHEINDWLKEREIEPEDGVLLVRRSVKSNGRSVISVQGQLVTRADLAHLADSLIDMHGQSEHQSLLSDDKQRKIVDNYAKTESLIKQCAQYHSKINELRNRQQELVSKSQEYKAQQDWLEFAVNEIKNADPKPNEDEELKDKIAVFSNYESIYENVENTVLQLKQAKSSMYDASSLISKAAKCDASLSGLSDRTESCRIETDDIIQELSAYINGIDYSEEAFDRMQERLTLLQKLKRKYGSTIEEVLKFAQDAEEKLKISENSQELLETCIKEAEEAENEYRIVAGKLSERRKKASEDLEKKIEKVLKTLGMPNVRFSIEVTFNSEKISSEGSDTVSFMICPNTGEKLRQMKEIASGGELSRVMLALKTVLAEADSISTQVFDEVDTGIGGSVALSLASCITDLSQSKQVIVVTHLASIAGKADRHFVVSKSVENGRTFTKLKHIDGEERVEEIARMLSGDTDSVTLQHARNMLGK